MAESSSVFHRTKKLEKYVASAYRPLPSIACPSFMFAFPTMQQFRQALATAAVFIIPDTTAVTQTFRCEVNDFPPNVRILVKLTSHREHSSPPVFSSEVSSNKGAAGSLEQGRFEQEQTGFSSLFPASFGRRS